MHACPTLEAAFPAFSSLLCGRGPERALCPQIATQPMHGMGIEIRARGMRQVWVHVQRFRRREALEDGDNG